MKILFLILYVCFVSPYVSAPIVAQTLTDEHKLQLELAKKETKRFLDQYRSNWDFRKTWESFRSKGEQCGIEIFDRAFGIKSGAFSEKVKASKKLQNDYFFAFWDLFLVGGAYIFSSAPVTANGPDPDKVLLPAELTEAEKKFKFAKIFDTSEHREPASEKELRTAFEEMREYSLLLKRHMPADAMNNSAWIQSVDFFHKKYRPNAQIILKEEIEKDGDKGDFACSAKYAPIYSIAITDQYFVWIDEGGTMRLLTVVGLVD